MNRAMKLSRLNRRTFLRSAGIAVGLPLLDAMQPVRAATPGFQNEPPKRMLAICNNLGLLPSKFFPERSGAGYQLSPYLDLLDQHRDNFTVFSGVSHPEVDGGHPADNCFLTAAPHPGRGGFRNTISLDQVVAEHYGHQTRFPSLTLGVNVESGLRSLSWTAQGVLIPCEQSASQVFAQLYLEGTPQEKRDRLRKLRHGASILDAIGGQAKQLRRSVSREDRTRLDQYYSGVRELETRMTKAGEWETRPKPHVDRPVPLDPANPADFMAKTRLMYDMARLAFETDSTRSISLLLDGVNTPALNLEGEQTSGGYHNLSHHGKRPEKIAELERIDRWHMRLLDELLGNLNDSTENGQNLLDQTVVLYGSNLGDANMHSTTNMPILLAGGSFRHGQHLAFEQQKNYPLPNLYVSMLQQLGIETDQFASSTGTMRGLETR